MVRGGPIDVAAARLLPRRVRRGENRRYPYAYSPHWNRRVSSFVVNAGAGQNHKVIGLETGFYKDRMLY